MRDGGPSLITCSPGSTSARHARLKQRLTATRVRRQLREEGYEVGVTVARERRRRQPEVYVPLVHRPGDEAQVDFFEVTVEVGVERRKAWQFVIRLMYSGHDYVRLYER